VQINMLLCVPTRWLSVMLLSASVAGTACCVRRVLYAKGYYAAAASCGKGFGIVALAQVFLLTTAGIGAVRAFLA
jgi:hypothetical protein